jgi:hypothetical protein
MGLARDRTLHQASFTTGYTTWGTLSVTEKERLVRSHDRSSSLPN